LLPHALVTLLQISTNYIKSYANTLPMLNVVIKHPLIPEDNPLPTFRSAARHSSRPSSSELHVPPRNSLTNSWTLRRPCTTRHAFSHLTTPRQLMSSTPRLPCIYVGNQHFRTRFPIEYSHPRRLLWLTTNPSLRYQKSSTPKLTTAVVPASYYTSSTGQVTKVPTKKHPGYSLRNLDTLRNSSQTFTLRTQPNPAPSQVSLKSQFSSTF